MCDEVAVRARHNVELILDRLTSAGCRFHSNDDRREDVTPFVSATDCARWLEDTFGPVPLTVLAWVLVGDVWLVGDHPRSPHPPPPQTPWPSRSRAPATPTPPCETTSSRTDAWREQNADQEHPALFTLPLSPDRLHKDNVSGGLQYGLVLPDGCADGLFVGETTMPFVAYLNAVFAHGGLPQTAGSDHTWWQIRTSLARDLLPL